MQKKDTLIDRLIDNNRAHYRPGMDRCDEPTLRKLGQKNALSYHIAEKNLEINIGKFLRDSQE